MKIPMVVLYYVIAGLILQDAWLWFQIEQAGQQIAIHATEQAKTAHGLADASAALTRNEQQLCGNVRVLAAGVRVLSVDKRHIDKTTAFAGLETFKGAKEQQRAANRRSVVDKTLSDKISEMQFANCSGLIVPAEIQGPAK